MSALLTTKRQRAATIVAECILAGGLDDMLNEILEWEVNQPVPYIPLGTLESVSIVGNS